MNLKNLRKENKKRQTDIANQLNIPIATYVRYENGETAPNIETLCKLADYFGVSLDYLVERNFGNEFYYLTDNEKLLILKFRELTTYNQAKIIGEVSGMLIAQN